MMLKEKAADEKETALIAEKLAAKLKPGISIGFSGSLGAGKTTFIRYLVKALGSDDAVSSPTYVLQHLYNTDSGLTIEHWDLYRLSGAPDELMEIVPANHIRLIEWPERNAEKPDYSLVISVEADNSRTFVFSAN